MASFAAWSLPIFRQYGNIFRSRPRSSRAAESLLHGAGRGQHLTFVCFGCRLKQSRKLHQVQYYNNKFHYVNQRTTGPGSLFHCTSRPAHNERSGDSARHEPETELLEYAPPSKYLDLEHEAHRFQKEWSPSPEMKTSIPTRENPYQSDLRQPSFPAKNQSSPTLVKPTSASQRVHHFSDQVIESLTRIAHKLNIYTGTDYTPIQSLRESIKVQESSLRAHHQDVASAKTIHAAALNMQRVHQKEVVQLLERKHSWTDTDMERYMSLIRSEHVNERAVENAQREIIQAERTLEEARQELEHSERKMYHEEQVWSDTIRRNSTWITFGLMGFNVVLLLAQIIVVEPWRRKRLVMEVRNTLDEKSALAPSVIPTLKDEARTREHAKVEAEIDEAMGMPVEPKPSVEMDAVSTMEATLDTGRSAVDTEAKPQKTHGWREATGLPAHAIDHLPPHPLSSFDAFSRRESWLGLLGRLQIILYDKFSDRTISLRNIDFTSARLETLSLGVLFGSFAVFLGALMIDD